MWSVYLALSPVLDATRGACHRVPPPRPMCAQAPASERRKRSLRSAAPSYIICILLQVVMQVIALHSQTPTLKTRDPLAYIIETPAYENTLYLYRLVEIHTEILWCVYTHTNTRADTQRLSLHKRCCSLAKKLTQQYVREEEKKKIFNYVESFSVNLC